MKKYYRNYWSCTNLAKKIHEYLGSSEFEKRSYISLKEMWDSSKDRRKNHKLAFFLTDTLDAIQNIIYFPLDVYETVKCYINNRFVNKIHYLDTKLARGTYYDLDTRILYGVFESFVDFIECEKAWMNVAFDDEKRKHFPSNGRSPNDGIEHLLWEINLPNQEETFEGESKMNQSQAEFAKEQYELYNWWKNVRPTRIDPWEEKNEDPLEIELSYTNEDTEMLIRLIKIRNSLWT